jgi:hypothetical protein
MMTHNALEVSRRRSTIPFHIQPKGGRTNVERKEKKIGVGFFLIFSAPTSWKCVFCCASRKKGKNFHFILVLYSIRNLILSYTKKKQF